MITVKGKVQLKMGAPACSHILYGCYTQNNLLYKDTWYIMKHLFPFLTQLNVPKNYFASQRVLHALRGRPHFYCIAASNVILNLSAYFFIYCMVLGD